MTNTSLADLETGLISQQAFFATGVTKNVRFRLEQLKKLQQAIQKHEPHILEALSADLHKSAQEGYLTEISLVNLEIRNHRRHLRRWSRTRRVRTPLHLLPSRSRILHEPLGVALIVAAWNYPFQLLINPLVGAISSGCCAVLKPSPYTPRVAEALEAMIRETFPPEYIRVVQGNREVNNFLFSQRFDFIFYTGSPAVGKVVMAAAARNLTPLVLELGGKSPCMVDAEANLSIAAKRIVWGKTINAGQTCIAPDYLLVHESVKEALIEKMASLIDTTFGPDIRTSPWYPRIVSRQAAERLKGLMQQGRIRYGGGAVTEERFVAPTLIDEVEPGFAILQEEIFGPLLPIISYRDTDEAIRFITGREKPLALYYFGHPGKGRRVFERTSSGGGCINDTLLHISNHHLPFGGVGNSGLGKYHGKESFLAFSNRRALIISPTWFDLPVKYAPFPWFRWVRKII